MAEKRRGLGKGLGALIPSSPTGDRPVDVFFPGAQQPGRRRARRDRAGRRARTSTADGNGLLPVPGAHFAEIPIRP